MDLYKILSLKKGESVPEGLLLDSDEKRFAFKLLKDRRYKRLYDKSEKVQEVVDAGFFDDKIEDLDYDLNFLTTPWHKLKKKKGVVLMSTGGFAPVHEGHIQMMESAKELLESKGFEVIGGYLSPSHDVYVQSKDKNMPSIGSRIKALHEKVSDNSWLMVDPWEGRFTKSSINFTDVIDRTKYYLEKRGFEVDIAYVFGSDNQDFVKAFGKEELCVCVQRKSQIKRNSFEGFNFWIDEKEHAHVSSTIIRQELSKADDKKDPSIYLIRDDREFGLKGDEEFFQGLEKALKNSVLHLKIETVRIPLSRQKTLIENIEGKFINLDSCTDKGHKLDFCRNFGLADGQVKSFELIERPGYKSLKEQIKKLESGTFDLVDDDIASGTTIRFLKSLLPPTVQINKSIALSHLFWMDNDNLSKLDYEFYDIVDFRDFLVGSHQGGLVVEKEYRVPYMLPYVHNTFRSKLSADKEFEFSKTLWTLNVAYYSKNPTLLSEVDPAFSRLMKTLGFSEKSTMEEICRWHLQRL